MHLYRCTNPDMRAAIKDELEDMSDRLDTANVPYEIRAVFLNRLASLTNTDMKSRPACTREAWQAMEYQDELGTFAILRGHHHVYWAKAIMDLYRRRSTPPGVTPRKDRTPFDMSVLLIENSWRLFQRAWDARNTILHNDDSYGARAESSRLLAALFHFKNNQNELLHYGDRHLIDIPHGVIVAWDRKRRQKMHTLLTELSTQYLLEVNLQRGGQSQLTKYGFTVLAPSENDTDARSDV